MKKIFLILLLGVVLRIAAVYIYDNIGKDYYWEYGSIAKNLIHDRGYSLFYFYNGEIENTFRENVQPYPSAYMLPGYVYFLLPFMYIHDVVLRNILLLLIHISLSLLTIYLLYLLTKKYFSERTALLTALFVAVLPEFIYSTISFTPTILYQFLVVVIFLFLTGNMKRNKIIFFTGFLIAATVYLRSEFMLFWLLLTGVFLISKKIRHAVIIFSTVIILILPWSIRNIAVFKEPVLFTTSFGLNLYRGNNPLGVGVWGSDSLFEEINHIKGNDFEITYNKMYMDASLDYIKNNPIKVMGSSFVKLFYTLFYYPNDPRSRNPLYFIPAAFLSLIFIISLFLTFSWDKFKYFYVFIFSSITIAVVFSPLPRYIAMMKIFFLPFAAYGLIYLWDRFLKSPD